VSRLSIAPIVEGHGEDSAVRLLLQRTWALLGGEFVEVHHPIRRSRGKLLRTDSGDLEKAINFAAIKLQTVQDRPLALILIDAEGDCQMHGALGPALLSRAQAARSDIDIACVIANVMYETWFVAAAESLQEYLSLRPGEEVPPDPEAAGLGKRWIKQRIRGGKYSETADQAALTSAMDLQLCRMRSPSFDKLCRELELRR
jgi:hypothetical protein